MNDKATITLVPNDAKAFDELRREEQDLPSRAEMVRRLMRHWRDTRADTAEGSS